MNEQSGSDQNGSDNFGIWFNILFKITFYVFSKNFNLEIFGEKVQMGTTLRCFIRFWTNPGNSILYNGSGTAICHPSHKPFMNGEQDITSTAAKSKDEFKSDVFLWNPILG